MAHSPQNGRVKQARDFATAAHGPQRYGNEPYVVHLDAVAKLLEPFGAEAEVIGYLHDVAEDTPVTLEALRATFGDHVADCVALVTDEPGANRPERKARTHAKLAKAGDALNLALIVKTADRLANVRMSASTAAGSKMEMYRNEYAAFRIAVFRPELCDELWAELDQLLGPGLR
ncbi:MAG TPA: HD domain-containing protein [Tepidisphaeraceae bacterium]|jgi:(p)ppGpp synthase/HD superfamily hydrolase|nr:HD domain-containing protein [Tepidisphaeraceae bacterium]